MPMVAAIERTLGSVATADRTSGSESSCDSELHTRGREGYGGDPGVSLRGRGVRELRQVIAVLRHEVGQDVAFNARIHRRRISAELFSSTVKLPAMRPCESKSMSCAG